MLSLYAEQVKQKKQQDVLAMNFVKDRIAEQLAKDTPFEVNEFLAVMEKLSEVAQRNNFQLPKKGSEPTTSVRTINQLQHDRELFMQEKIVAALPDWLNININDWLSQLSTLEKIGIASLPVVGDLIDLYELASGKDFFTGAELTRAERLLSAAGLLVGSGQALRQSAGVLAGILQRSGRSEGSGIASEAGRRGASDGPDTSVARLCSFHGDTLVLTNAGYQKIHALKENGYKVWSRDESSGLMDWQQVKAHYSNTYEETVYVTLEDDKTQASQTIISNKVHPFFVNLTEFLRNNGGYSSGLVPISSEGHTYTDSIKNGYWVDASELKSGYRLLNSDETWSTVVDVRIEKKSLQAYNLTVDAFNTYFVKGSADAAQAVWVHNNCWTPKNITNPKNWNGCEQCARDIQSRIGGDIARIKPLDRTASLGWV